jgi:hypothetical protein
VLSAQLSEAQAELRKATKNAKTEPSGADDVAAPLAEGHPQPAAISPS